MTVPSSDSALSVMFRVLTVKCACIKCYKYLSHLEVTRSAFVTSPGGTGMNAGPERWEYSTLDGENYPYPISGDATCPGTLIDKSMSLNQDAGPTPGGC